VQLRRRTNEAEAAAVGGLSLHAAVSNRDGTSNGTDHIAGHILDHNKGPVPGTPPVEWA